MNKRRAPRSAALRRQGHALWVSLFAMLMVFAGPLISQSMPMDHDAGMAMEAGSAMGSGMSMPMATSMPMHHGSQHGAPAAADNLAQAAQPQPTSELHPLWEKCGYCNLMLHCPALPQTLTLLSAPASPEPHAQHYFIRAGYGRQAIFPGALTRAPPPALFA